MIGRETIRLSHSPFRISGPEVEFIVETWRCCRDWPIVVATITYTNGADEWPRREAWHIRKCGICRDYPRPLEDR